MRCVLIESGRKMPPERRPGQDVYDLKGVVRGESVQVSGLAVTLQVL